MTTSPFPPYKTAAVAELVPYARNARTHSDAQVAQIAASISEFGFTNPVLVDGEHGVIAGHGRLLAARKLGMTEVPTIELNHLTTAQRRAYILADNKLAMKLTAVFMKVPEGYVAFIEDLPGGQYSGGNS